MSMSLDQLWEETLKAPEPVENSLDVMRSDAQILGSFYQFMTPEMVIYSNLADSIEKSVTEMRQEMEDNATTLQDLIKDAKKGYEYSTISAHKLVNDMLVALDKIEKEEIRPSEQDMSNLKRSAAEIGRIVNSMSEAMSPIWGEEEGSLSSLFRDMISKTRERTSELLEAAQEIKEHARLQDETLRETFQKLMESPGLELQKDDFEIGD